jgi:hypothetical protein
MNQVRQVPQCGHSSLRGARSQAPARGSRGSSAEAIMRSPIVVRPFLAVCWGSGRRWLASGACHGRTSQRSGTEKWINPMRNSEFGPLAMAFQKPAITGLELGNKRIFKIEPWDLVFNNVFAWEGAIAVARAED